MESHEKWSEQWWKYTLRDDPKACEILGRLENEERSVGDTITDLAEVIANYCKQ